jgi:hypothetical protein
MATISPRRSNFARCKASRASVLTRRAARRRSPEGASTSQRTFAAVKHRGQPEPRQARFIRNRHRTGQTHKPAMNITILRR